MSKELSKRLRIKAGVMQMGEKIAWGSDTDLMYEAADNLDEKDKELAALRGFANEMKKYVELERVGCGNIDYFLIAYKLIDSDGKPTKLLTGDL